MNKSGPSPFTSSFPTITSSSDTFDTSTTVWWVFGDRRLADLAPYEVLLYDGFCGKPIILETEPDQEFLGFMLETKPLELIYQGPTNVSQVLSPYPASRLQKSFSAASDPDATLLSKGPFLTPEYNKVSTN